MNRYIAALALVLTLQTPTPIDLVRQAQAILAQLQQLLAPPVVTDLQAAIDAAKPGDTITLRAGQTYTGNFMLRKKTGTGVITITSDANVPAPGTRVAVGTVLPIVKQGSGGPAFATEAGAQFYSLIGLEIAGVGAGDLITLGDGSSAQNSLALVPHDLIVDRCYIHGDPTLGQKRGVALNSAATTVKNSTIVDIKWQGQDSQAVGGWNGPGPFTIDNNDLEASGENVMFGGADPAIPNLVPSNITITNNYVAKPVAWQTQGWQIKNLLELKNADTVTISGNLFEHTWPGGQIGAAILFNPRDQGAGDDPNHAQHAPWCRVASVTFASNIVRHVAHGFNLTGVDNYDPASKGSGYVIRGNLLYDVSGDGFRFSNGPIAGLTIDHNTIVSGNSLLQTDAIQPAASAAAFTRNIGSHGSYGIHTPNWQEGNASLAAMFPAATFDYNAIAGAPGWLYPAAHNVYPADLSLLVNYAPTGALAVMGDDGKVIGCDLTALPAFNPTE